MKNIIIALLINFIFSAEWGIDTTHSYIKYTGNHTLHSWEGVSKNIDFSLSCDDNDRCSLNISTPLESLGSGNDSRDSNMLWYTESLKYPRVSFTSKNFKYSGGIDTSIELEGDIDFHGIKKAVPVIITLTNNSDGLWGVCNFSINLDDFGVEKPSLLMIRISEIIEIESKLKIVSLP